MNRIIETTLASAVTNGNTVNISYPAGTNKGMFFGGVRNALSINGTGYKEPVGFTLAYNATNVTVTNNSGATWPQGARVMLELQIPGARNTHDENGSEVLRTVDAGIQLVTLGAPITADPDGISASQNVTIATTPLALLNGALASGGKVVLDVPRNVVAAWTGAAVVTVTGTDEHGNPVTVTGDGLLARCLQHETDHTLGRVFGDRLPTRQRKKLTKAHDGAAANYPEGWPAA